MDTVRLRSKRVDIEAVAEDIVTIETCEEMTPRVFPDLQRDRSRNPFLDARLPAAAARLYWLRNVLLDRRHMVLLHQGRIIAQTNYLQDPAALAGLRVRVADVVRIEPTFPTVLCFDHWHVNFYHWLVHTMPAVHLTMQRHPGGGVRLVLPSLLAWQKESLDLAGAGQLPTCTTADDGQYFFTELAYLDITAGSLDYALSPLSQAACARLSAAVPDRGGDPLRIYIDRTWTVHRRLVNEPALIDALRTRGFVIVQPETLSFADQIDLFRRAAMVVGTLGAGLANIAFCRPGTVIYEIVPAHHRNPCFLTMAARGGLIYWADEFNTGVDVSSYVTPWALPLDIAAVLRRIDDLEAFVTR